MGKCSKTCSTRTRKRTKRRSGTWGQQTRKRKTRKTRLRRKLPRQRQPPRKSNSSPTNPRSQDSGDSGQRPKQRATLLFAALVVDVPLVPTMFTDVLFIFDETYQINSSKILQFDPWCRLRPLVSH